MVPTMVPIMVPIMVPTMVPIMVPTMVPVKWVPSILYQKKENQKSEVRTMAKKSFIKLKRGILSGRHFEQMGITVWLYLYILDHTDWEEGVYRGYADRDAAEALGMSARTARRWRVKLEEGAYIVCRQSRHSQTIYVHNWSNPKENWGQQDGGEQIDGSGAQDGDETQRQASAR